MGSDLSKTTMQQSGLIKTENGFAVFDVQPGSYSFSSQIDKPA
jgi:hypothetical protein